MWQGPSKSLAVRHAAAALLVAVTTLGNFVFGLPSALQHQIYIQETALVADSLVNIYLEYAPSFLADWQENDKGNMTLSFGACNVTSLAETYPATIIGSTSITRGYAPRKFAWTVHGGHTAAGCFSAHVNHTLVAMSDLYNLLPKRDRKRGIPELAGMRFFDAVKYFGDCLKMRSEKNKAVPIKEGDTKIGIIGAGASGLFSAYLLEMAGFYNYEILEASNRLGGRMQTVYFGNSTTAYQEMGAMRIPIKWKHDDMELPITDHGIVFQLVDELNRVNDPEHKVAFIPWIDSTPSNRVYRNGVRLPNGNIPTRGYIDTHPDYFSGDPPELVSEVLNGTSELNSIDFKKLISKDVHKAYQEAIEKGYEDWSEWGWLHNKLGLSLNATDFATSYMAGTESIWTMAYFAFLSDASEWRTIQGGFSRLGNAFSPLVGHKVQFGTKVTKISFDNAQRKIAVQWRDRPNFRAAYQTRVYDNVIVSAPFSVVRTWDLPSTGIPYMLRRSIQYLRYGQSCKVAIEFKTRFWEKLPEEPIRGGCDMTDLLIGMICYPSNDIGSDGSGVMLASYGFDDAGLRFASMPEEEHVTHVLDKLVEIHGDIVKEEYTGNYHRKCWVLDEFQSGAWAHPSVGQQKLFIPSYFEHAQGLVFVGEHTDMKHAWVSAALESAVRGVVMVLVENGHVDAAKHYKKMERTLDQDIARRPWLTELF